MCGIFGKVGRFEEKDMQIATSALCHRGPDGQVYKTYDEKIHFFHARLSIVDIEGGTQPMQTPNTAIIFNGEIYNHEDLRKQYQLKTQTRSDTETLMLLYELKGLKMLDDCDGMFAIALYDKKSKKLLLIRDRSGKKPLYYTITTSGELYWSSELNVLHKLLRPQISHPAIAEYLITGMIYGSDTCYDQVNELKPGHYLELDVSDNIMRHAEQQCWWHIDRFYRKHTKITEQDAIEETERLLEVAVKRRIESSDLEVASFLSGGIDSGIVSALAMKVKSRLRTFTVKFDGDYDESPVAKGVAKHLGTEHYELPVSYGDLLNDLENIVAAYGEPFMDDSLIPSWYVARAAKQHVTVIINGDGGDEMFGGYRRYVAFANPLLNNAAIRQAGKLIGGLLPAPSTKMNLYNYLYRLLKAGSLDTVDRYLAASTDLLWEQRCSLRSETNTKFEQKIQSVFAEPISDLRKVMLADFSCILPYILLKKIDISSMQHSLEGRSPFLAKEILEFAPTLPDDLKIKGTTTKYILRKIAGKYLPQGNEKLPKKGFELPLINMMDGVLKNMLHDYVGSKNALHRQFLPQDLVSAYLNNSVSVSADKRARVLFALLSLEIWNRKVSA